MHDERTRLAQDVERELRSHFSELVFDTVIPRSVRVAEAPSFGIPVLEHAPSSRGSVAYAELAGELARREDTTGSPFSTTLNQRLRSKPAIRRMG